MARLFGTDGVRGIANRDLNCELAFKIGAVQVQAPLYKIADIIQDQLI